MRRCHRQERQRFYPTLKPTPNSNWFEPQRTPWLGNAVVSMLLGAAILGGLLALSQIDSAHNTSWGKFLDGLRARITHVKVEEARIASKQRWRKRELTMSIDSPEYDYAFRRAAWRWSGTGRVKIRVINSTKRADIKVRNGRPLPGSVGTAYYWYIGNKITDAEIVVDRRDAVLGLAFRVALAEHELGHALGLGHDRPGTIMYGIIRTRNPGVTLTWRDRSALARLYP